MQTNTPPVAIRGGIGTDSASTIVFAISGNINAHDANTNLRFHRSIFFTFAAISRNSKNCSASTITKSAASESSFEINTDTSAAENAGASRSSDEIAATILPRACIS